MSGVLQRTVYYHPGDSLHDRRVRFIDWAKVETGLGSMWEPWSMTMWFPGDGLADFDPAADDISRVDFIEPTSRQSMGTVLFDGDLDDTNRKPIHGGLQWPRANPL